LAAVPATKPSAAGANLFESRLTATDAWLKQGSGSTVTIQLLGAESEPQLKEHLNIIAKFVETNQLFVYRTTAKEKPYLIVLYGSFANRKSAMDALDQLPAPVKAFRPYLRSLGGLRGDDTRGPTPPS
jgi:septal ring-binding cell division protein DamX